MPIYSKPGSDAASLVSLLEQVLANGERPVQWGPAGDSWVVVSEKKPGPKPKPLTR